MSDRPHSPGMQGVEGTPLEAMRSPRRWGWRRLALQGLGLVIGLGLLGWAIHAALSDANRASILAMRDASAGQVSWLMGLTFLSLVLNGLMFWVTLRVAHALKWADVVMVNFLCTFLSILPFKLSLVTRMLVHHRRDGVPLRLLVAWVAAMGALALAVLLPLMAATMARKDMDAWWWVIALGGVAVCNAAGLLCGRWAEKWKLLHRLSLGSDQIVRDWRAVVGHALLRVVDTAVLAARFGAAAAIAGRVMPAEQAVLLATTYFLLSVLTPAGTLGFREAGTAALGMTQGLTPEQVALVTLVVSGAEVLTAGVGALAGFAWIRPDRLIFKGRGWPRAGV